MWIAAAALLTTALVLMVDWTWVRCRLLGHPLQFSRPYELTDGFSWFTACTRCPEHGELFVRCGADKKNRLFVYCPETDHPMSPRYCMSNPHEKACHECAYKANASLAEEA